MTDLHDLRGDIRHWRRGRANTTLIEVLEDAYVALFATLMFGSALVNVVLGVRRAGSEGCVAAGCLEARTILPWVFAVGGVVVTLGLARMFGPVFVTPAVASWLLTTPVDRPAVLRPRLIGTAVLALVGTGAVAAGAAALGGFTVPSLLAFTGSAALLGVGAVCVAALTQASGGITARALLVLTALAAWSGLLLLALGRAPIASPPVLRTGWATVLLALGLMVVALFVYTLRRLGRLRTRDVAPGGSLAPGMSGALANLDLALAYDVVLAHRWHRHDAVTARRGGPSGLWSLVWLDGVRLRRSPQNVVWLAAAAVVPYAAQQAGGGRIVVLIAVFVGFAAGLPLLAGLRTITRTAAIARALPFPERETRTASLAVPAVLFGLYGLATIGAVRGATEQTWDTAALTAVAVGACALAASTRWVTGRPPDYGRPLVSTPSGAVPANLYGSVVRGFDVAVLASAPILISPTGGGSAFSILIAVGVLAYLVGRE